MDHDQWRQDNILLASGAMLIAGSGARRGKGAGEVGQ